MWYCKGAKPKLKKSFHSSLFTFSKEEYRSAFLQISKEFHQYQELIKEGLGLDSALKKLQPQASIKIKLNTNDTIPDCHHPNTIQYKYTNPVGKITKFIFCSTGKRVYTIAMPRKNIRITFMVCADEQMCKESYLLKGFVASLGDQLAIVPPGFEDKFVSCCIEHPNDTEFGLIIRDLPEFMKSVEETNNLSDTSDLDLSSEEESEQE